MTDVTAIPTAADQYLDKAAEIQKAKEEIAGPVPLIEVAPNCTLELPRGLYYQGQWHQQVTVRELTGRDEEALAKLRDSTDFFDMVLALGTAKLGTLIFEELAVSERQAYLRSLLIGERDQVFFAIAKATYGVDKEMRYTCPSCNYAQTLILHLDTDFPVKEVSDINSTTFTHVTTKGQTLEYHLATGADQLEALKHKNSSMAEQNTVILSRCVTKADGEPLVDPVNFARGLSMRDRQALSALLVEKQPTIDMTVPITCIECEEVQQAPLGWGDIFVPDEQALFMYYDAISTNYPGWPLSEIREMTLRQRTYWLKMLRWKKDRRV